MQETKLRGMPFFTKLMSVFAGLTLGSAVLAAPAVPAGPPQVTLKTNMGDIVLELNQEAAPKSVANFLQYVNSGFYKGTVFHRVIDGFMIQGGGFDKNMKQKSTKKAIVSESKNGLKNATYSVAMARTGDPNSATSQFFINVADNGGLDYPGQDGFGYTVFGKVVKGMDVVDKIRAVPTSDSNSGAFQDVPVKPIVIESATLLKSPAAAKTVK